MQCPILIDKPPSQQVRNAVDFDSFLKPLLEDLTTLATEGILAYQYDDLSGRLKPFQLKAHLLTVTGDMPAVSKVGRFIFQLVRKTLELTQSFIPSRRQPAYVIQGR
jgi:hypothetical protein